MQVEKRHCLPWESKSEYKVEQLKLYEEQKGVGVVFVAGQHTVGVHSHVLKVHGSHLGDLEKNSDGSVNEVPAGGEDFRLVEIFTRYLYMESLLEEFNYYMDAVFLLKSADKYGVVRMKMLLEARVVGAKDTVTADSAVEMRVDAESFNCALLREAAVEKLVSGMTEVEEEKWYDLLPYPDLITEAIDPRKRNKPPNKANTHVLDRLNVSALRALPSYKCFDVDCSHETLVKLLKEAENES